MQRFIGWHDGFTCFTLKVGKLVYLNIKIDNLFVDLKLFHERSSNGYNRYCELNYFDLSTLQMYRFHLMILRFRTTSCIRFACIVNVRLHHVKFGNSIDWSVSQDIKQSSKSYHGHQSWELRDVCRVFFIWTTSYALNNLLFCS